jgi:hypothetical protein
MLHRQRHWTIAPAESASALADKLTQHTWCGCNGFRLGEYWFVNDATSPDGAQEYGVLKPAEAGFVQIESLTFSWMTPEQAIDMIGRVLAGEFDGDAYDVITAERLETPQQHGRCPHCA